MTTRSDFIVRLLLAASVITIGSAGWSQTATPTPTATFTPTQTPTLTPEFGGMAGRYDSTEHRQAMDRAAHIFTRGYSVAEPQETRAYIARPVLDAFGNSKVDLVNFMTNTTFPADTTGWSVSGSVSKAFDGTQTDIDGTGGSGGSMLLTWTGAGTAYYNVGVTIESAGWFTFGVMVRNSVAQSIDLEMDLSSPTNTSVKTRQTSGVSTEWSVVTITKWVAAGQQIDNVGITMSTSGVMNIDNVGLYRSPIWPGYIPEGILAGGVVTYTDLNVSGDINMGDDILWDSDTRILYDAATERMAIHLGNGTFYGDIKSLNDGGFGYSITPVPTQNLNILALDEEWYAQNGFLVIRSNSATGDVWSAWESDPAKTMTPLPARVDYGLHVDHDTHLYEDIGLYVDAYTSYRPNLAVVGDDGPPTWDTSAFGVLNLGATGGLWSQRVSQVGNRLDIAQNVYYDGSANKYNVTDEASMYRQSDGTHLFRVAASGTSGDTISFTDRMTINPTGVYVGGLTTNGPVYTSGGNGLLNSVNTLGPTMGGTGQTTVTTGDLLYGSAANVWSKLAGVATGNALISGGVSTAPSWGKIGLTTHVSGTLPIANGGTNITTYTTGDLLYASASNTLAKRAIGTEGYVLKVVSGVPNWAAESGGGGGDITDITAWTAGAIGFGDTGNVGGIDATNFVWDNTNKRIGHGTASPAVGYHQVKNNASTDPLVRLTQEGSGDSGLQYFLDDGSATYWTHGIDNSASGNPFVISNSSALGTSDVMTLNSSGIGLGTFGMPSLNTSYRGLGTGTGNLMFHTSTAQSVHLSQNAYLNTSSQWIYTANGRASNVYLSGGTLNFRTSNASGTAGNVITWLNPITTDTSGNVDMDYDLNVDGSAVVDGNASVGGRLVTLQTTPASLTGAGPHSVSTTNLTYIRLGFAIGSSGNMQLNAGTVGQHLILHCYLAGGTVTLADDAANTDSGNVRLSAAWAPNQYDTLSLIFDGTDWIETARSAN